MKKGGVSQGYMPGKETRVEGVDIFEASSMTSTFANTAFVQSSQKNVGDNDGNEFSLLSRV